MPLADCITFSLISPASYGTIQRKRELHKALIRAIKSLIVALIYWLLAPLSCRVRTALPLLDPTTLTHQKDLIGGSLPSDLHSKPYFRGEIVNHVSKAHPAISLKSERGKMRLRDSDIYGSTQLARVF